LGVEGTLTPALSQREREKGMRALPEGEGEGYEGSPRGRGRRV